jgi:hypothetical protein
MNVHSPATLAAIATLASDHTHFFVNANGSVDSFTVDACEHCGIDCRGANPVRWLNVPRSALFVIARMEPCDIRDESGCNDYGDVVCPNCGDSERTANGGHTAEQSARDKARGD